MNHIINIELNKKEDYINKFNNKRISQDLNNYILEEVKTVELNNKITIHNSNGKKLFNGNEYNGLLIFDKNIIIYHKSIIKYE